MNFITRNAVCSIIDMRIKEPEISGNGYLYDMVLELGKNLGLEAVVVKQASRQLHLDIALSTTAQEHFRTNLTLPLNIFLFG